MDHHDPVRYLSCEGFLERPHNVLEVSNVPYVINFGRHRYQRPDKAWDTYYLKGGMKNEGRRRKLNSFMYSECQIC
jgi:hypothetical protein